MPIMITETSANRDIPGRARGWMKRLIQSVRSAWRVSPSLAIHGFHSSRMIDWAYRKGRRPLKDYLIHLGLYDSAFDSKGVLRRHKTPLVKRYQRHIANPMPPIRKLTMAPRTTSLPRWSMEFLD